MKMEGIMNFAVDWCAADEVVLRCVSVSFLVVVNEWQYKGILDEKDEQTWEDMSEDGTPSWRSSVPAQLFECFDSSASLGAQSHRHSSKIGVLGHGTFERIKEFSFVTVQKKETSEVIWNLLTVVSRMPQKSEILLRSEFCGQGVKILLEYV